MNWGAPSSGVSFMFRVTDIGIEHWDLVSLFLSSNQSGLLWAALRKPNPGASVRQQKTSASLWTLLQNFSKSSIWENECRFYLYAPPNTFFSFFYNPWTSPSSSLPPSLHSPLLFVSVPVILWCRVEAGRRGAKLCRERQHKNSCCCTFSVRRAPDYSTMFLRLVGTGTGGPSHPHPFFSFFIFLFSYTASSPAPTANKLLLSAILSPPPPQSPVEALHLIFLWPALSSSTPPTFYNPAPLPRLSTLIPPSVFFPPFFPEGIWAKCLMGCNKWAKGWAVVRCYTSRQTPNSILQTVHFFPGIPITVQMFKMHYADQQGSSGSLLTARNLI